MYKHLPAVGNALICDNCGVLIKYIHLYHDAVANGWKPTSQFNRIQELATFWLDRKDFCDNCKFHDQMEKIIELD